ncbi:MAG: CRTAC1 family protein, partial [Limisphaerales bacterium]
MNCHSSPRLGLPVALVFSLVLVLTGCRRSAEPAGPPARVVDGMNQGTSLMGQYRYDEAVTAFTDVVEAAPELVEARINLANALFNRNRKEDLDAAGQLLVGVLAQEPENVRALYFQAIVQQHLGQAELAIPNLEKVVRQQPDDGAAWYLLALCKQRLGQPSEAEFLRAVEHRPYLYSAYYQLYQASMRAGAPDRAAGFLEKFKTLRESPLGESIELPQYNQMGDLALVRPLPASTLPPISRSQFQAGPAKELLTWPGPVESAAGKEAPSLHGLAVGDLNQDGLADLVVPVGRPGRLALWRQTPQGGFVEVTAGSGLESVVDALSCALGDFDNDELPDLFVVGASGNHLFRGGTNGLFMDVTGPAGLTKASGPGSTALFLDADHDGDLDVFVCGAKANQLWNNNGDGTFTDLAVQAAVADVDGGSVLVLPGDLDGDRDLDLVILREGRPARVFLNELLGQYREADLRGVDIRGDAGGVLQDLNGNGLLDLLVLGGNPRELRLFVGDGRGGFRADEAFDGLARSATSWGTLAGFRVVDLDLDGDLDLVGFGSGAHFILNDGRGRFVLQAEAWKPVEGVTLAGMEIMDVTGDLVPDLLAIERGATHRLTLAEGRLSPPSTALAIQPSGIRSRDRRTRSPASGFGVSLTARAGLREQRVFHTGQSGGGHQSWMPVVLGLGGAGKADYVSLLWPDGVAQVETALLAGQVHQVAELQRKISSCPVLFAWNGTRFEFVTDFAGVGGLGYFSAPGIAAPPQVHEHVKIEPGQLRARDGV